MYLFRPPKHWSLRNTFRKGGVANFSDVMWGKFTALTESIPPPRGGGGGLMFFLYKVLVAFWVVVSVGVGTALPQAEALAPVTRAQEVLHQ